MGLEVHKLHTKATQKEETVNTPHMPTKETEARWFSQVKTTEGTAAHVAQHAGKWQDMSVVIPVSKAST